MGVKIKCASVFSLEHFHYNYVVLCIADGSFRREFHTLSNRVKYLHTNLIYKTIVEGG